MKIRTRQCQQIRIEHFPLTRVQDPCPDSAPTAEQSLTSLISAIYHCAVVSYVWPPSSSGEPAPSAYAVIRDREEYLLAALDLFYRAAASSGSRPPKKR